MAEARKLILKVLLWSLALAAVAGVLAVLLASDVIWRVMGTGFLTAAAALLMMPLSLMVDRQKSQPAGLFGLAAVVVEFILILMMIWEVNTLVGGGWELFRSLWMTVNVAAGSSVAAMIFLLARNRREARVAATVGLALTAAFFLAAMIASWLPGRQWDDEWWATSATIATMGVLVVAALVGVGSGDRRHWRWIGVAASAVAAVMLLAEFWNSTPWDGEIITLFVAAGIYVAYANVIMRVPLTPGQRWLRVGALVTGAATAIFSELIFFDLAGGSSGFSDGIVLRLDAAAAILTACGTLALAVLSLLNRRVNFESLSRELLRITIFCPRCRRKQSIELGGAACKACGLRINVRAEEPCCSRCGYLLYKLASDVCPECGTPIAAPARTG